MARFWVASASAATGLVCPCFTAIGSRSRVRWRYVILHVYDGPNTDSGRSLGIRHVVGRDAHHGRNGAEVGTPARLPPRDTTADSHRSPTNDTAHPGALVTPVKGADNGR